MFAHFVGFDLELVRNDGLQREPDFGCGPWSDGWVGFEWELDGLSEEAADGQFHPRCEAWVLFNLANWDVGEVQLA